ncbi:MAG: 1-deoxy-D-xylulose-5-phosphate synthase [Lachnospiraceae bacterium]|nr:1-deoxy-D-xylulose-5-phosphate synthase [Lachnospiraceae bacterium]MBQ5375697.1 1-deoxy-D-xylulose-5-phosphate synthase [Lachnospiraceae bacterium]
MYLEQIQKENDIKKIDAAHYDELAQEIRDFLIQKISVTGGHLGANLGCVELTMALHLALNLPEDKIIWDVGHQSYTHKLLTGRREGFDTLRTFGGMSGFPKRSESPCDPFNTGHSSTSISAGLGMVKARDLRGEKYSVVSVIGDGALTGGMAFEAINNAAKLNTNFIIVLNDNNMSISENVGGISKYLNGIRSAQGYLTFKEDIYHRLLDTKHGESLVQGIKHVKKNVKRMMVPGAYFEDLGLLYMGPVDGHDIITMRRMLTEAKKVDGPVLLHVLTHKGKGYAPAERHPARFHGAEPFDIETGLPSHPRTKASYTDIFSTVMLKMAARKKDVVAITAAMPDGVGLKRFRNVYPDRFFDVGIAEQHAVTFAAGLAAGGLHPVVAVYSSFLQRAYDQIIHDVCLQNLPVVFAVDRAGLVGSDGETHQGIFDLSYMTSIPNLTVMAPKNKWELSDMLKFAFDMQSPVAIRYPRGEAYDGLAEWRAPIEMGKSESIYEEEDICLVAFGSMVKTAVEVRKKLKEKGYACSLVNARFAKPVDEEMLRSLQKDHKLVVTLEENVEQGGFGEAVLEICVNRNLSFEVLNIALPDMYVEHGNVDILKQEIGVDPDSITKRIISRYVGL